LTASHVGLDDGVFEARRLADILAGVDVDGDQRLGLVDDDVAAALEPDLGLEALVDLLGDAELLEQRRVLGVELDARTRLGWKRVAKRRTRSYSSSVSTQICEKSLVTWSRSTRSTRLRS
jgi:hypothetical protein